VRRQESVKSGSGSKNINFVLARNPMSSILNIMSIVFFISCVSFVPASLDARETLALSKGRTVYVPAYSHIYTGANFIVKWKSATEVNPPIIESIMIGAQSSQGISFTSRGRAILSH
jgi:hypothetical protein